MAAQTSPNKGTPTRILACITLDTHAEAIIQAAYQQALQREAELHVLHVAEPGAATRRKPADAARLATLLRKAASKGAQTQVLQSYRVAATIVQVAQQLPAELVVVGPSSTAALKRLFRPTLAALLEAAGMKVLII
ncbi:MAG: hypothetical protein Fur005_04620 [Roseiflexaceae bacterium]